MAYDRSRNIKERIGSAFRNIGEGILTPRERQIVELILKGHSSDAIGKILEISSGTVRIHRRNIYIKLRINSQGELFSTFINALLVDGSANTPAPDPGFTAMACGEQR